MGCDGDGNDGWGVFKTFSGAVVLVVFMWLLFLGIVASREADGGAAAITTSSVNLRHVMFVGRVRPSVAGNPDVINTSKRRVPSGPDPIHNRHVGETRQPPGRE